MNLSLNWLKEYIDINETSEKIAELLTDLGLEVESMEEIGGIKGNLEGVVVGQVMECEKHPDADKLSITKVNIGSGDPQYCLRCAECSQRSESCGSDNRCNALFF